MKQLVTEPKWEGDPRLEHQWQLGPLLGVDMGAPVLGNNDSNI